MPADAEPQPVVQRALAAVGRTGRIGRQLLAAGPLRLLPEPARELPSVVLRLGLSGAVGVLTIVERLRKGPLPELPLEDVREEAAEIARAARRATESRLPHPPPSASTLPPPPSIASIPGVPSAVPVPDLDGDDALPIPDFDHITVASLRARLRQHDVADLARLRAHEQEHAHRPAVITMLDNRIAKLQVEQASHPVYPTERAEQARTAAGPARPDRVAGEDGGPVRR